MGGPGNGREDIDLDGFGIENRPRVVCHLDIEITRPRNPTNRRQGINDREGRRGSRRYGEGVIIITRVAEGDLNGYAVEVCRGRCRGEENLRD